MRSLPSSISLKRISLRFAPVTFCCRSSRPRQTNGRQETVRVELSQREIRIRVWKAGTRFLHSVQRRLQCSFRIGQSPAWLFRQADPGHLRLSLLAWDKSDSTTRAFCTPFPNCRSLAGDRGGRRKICRSLTPSRNSHALAAYSADSAPLFAGVPKPQLRVSHRKIGSI